MVPVARARSMSAFAIDCRPTRSRHVFALPYSLLINNTTWQHSTKTSAWRSFATLKMSRSACATPSTKNSTSSRCWSGFAQGQHRRQESVLRLGALQGLQGHHARSQFRVDRNPACAPIRQEFRRYPAGGRCARPVLHQVACQHLRHHQRRFRFFAAGVEAARKRQAGDRRRRQAIDLRLADRQLRRIHFLRRSGARNPPRRSQARRAGRQQARQAHAG